MPGPTLPNMSIVLPTVGGDTNAWGTEVNAALQILDPHDHSPGKGPRVPTTGIGINADLTMAGFGLTNLGRAAFSAITALATGSKALFVNSADNELYWRSNAGVNVKLTSGSTLNVSLVGGILGDYASVGAEVAYDDSLDRYTFKQQGSPKPWARMASGPIRLFEFNTTEAVGVEIACAAALASNYTITLPAAPPASTQLMQMSSAGAVSVSNTLTVTLAASAGLSGAGTVDFSSATSFRTPSRNIAFDIANGKTKAGTCTYDGAKVTFAAASEYDVGLFVAEGDEITDVTVFYSRDSGGNIVLSLLRHEYNGGAETVTVSKTISSGTGAASTSLATSPTSGSLPATLASNKSYFVRMVGGNTDDLHGVTVAVRHPT